MCVNQRRRRSRRVRRGNEKSGGEGYKEAREEEEERKEERKVLFQVSASEDSQTHMQVSNSLQSVYKCNGSRWKDSVSRFWLHLSSSIGSLLLPIWDFSTNKEEERSGGGALLQVR